MNKLTKIGALCFALCSLIISLQVIAGTTGDTKVVSLVLQDSDNSCTVEDYELGTHTVAGVDQPSDTDTGVINCTFLKNQSYLMNISLTDLSAGESKTIASSQFTGTFGTFTQNGTLDEFTGSSLTFSTTGQTIYTKDLNKIGALSGTLSIGGIIPAGTPAGSYTGTLDLTLQASGS